MAIRDERIAEIENELIRNPHMNVTRELVNELKALKRWMTLHDRAHMRVIGEYIAYVTELEDAVRAHAPEDVLHRLKARVRWREKESDKLMMLEDD